MHVREATNYRYRYMDGIQIKAFEGPGERKIDKFTSNYEPGLVKSSFLAIDLPFPSSKGEDSLRFLLLPFFPTFPSTSARGGVSSFLKHFGSLEGCVGKGRAKKYGWSRA